MSCEIYNVAGRLPCGNRPATVREGLMRQHDHKSKPTDRPVRLGVTLVEVLVSIGLLGMLLALLLPAIGNSRRAADTTQCRARLSQIGRANHNFEERHGHFAKGYAKLDWHYALLPDLEQNDLFCQLQGHEDDSFVEDIVRSPVMVFKCPSDPRFSSNVEVNFVRNGGSMFYRFENGKDSTGLNCTKFSSRDITDGLSMTAYASEQMNEFRWNSTDRRGNWRLPILYDQRNQLDLFADLCESMPTGAVGGPMQLSPNTFTRGSSERYDHIMRPNSPSCLSEVAGFAANSLHNGGVNVLMADGAVRFVNDHVSRPVWRAMGTRNGNETTALP